MQELTAAVGALVEPGPGIEGAIELVIGQEVLRAVGAALEKILTAAATWKEPDAPSNAAGFPASGSRLMATSLPVRNEAANFHSPSRSGVKRTHHLLPASAEVSAASPSAA